MLCLTFCCTNCLGLGQGLLNWGRGAKDLQGDANDLFIVFVMRT